MTTALKVILINGYKKGDSYFIVCGNKGEAGLKDPNQRTKLINNRTSKEFDYWTENELYQRTELFTILGGFLILV